MANLLRHVEVTRLLERLEALEDQLLANERTMVAELRAKYAEPGIGDPDDLLCLQVILRNIEIRKGYKGGGEEAGDLG